MFQVKDLRNVGHSHRYAQDYAQQEAVLMGNFDNAFSKADEEGWSQKFRDGRVSYLQNNNFLNYINIENKTWKWEKIKPAIEYWNKRKGKVPFFILLGAKQVKR